MINVTPDNAPSTPSLGYKDMPLKYKAAELAIHLLVEDKEGKIDTDKYIESCHKILEFFRNSE